MIVPNRTVEDPPAFIQLLAKHKVSRLVVVPALLNLLLDLDPDLDSQLPELALWVSSGESLPAELCRQFHRQMPGRTLLNLYGSTEVAADVTVFDTVNLKPNQQLVPIGRPIDNTQLYILPINDSITQPLQPVPIGVLGELVVGGAGVAAGYWQQDQLTRSRFVPNSSNPSEMFFRTGDLARYLADGTIELHGRNDQQLKINGNRIEPAEVEAALRSQEAITAAHLQAEEDRSGQRLVAYVVADEPLDSNRLRQHLANKLPGYMIPTHFVQLDQLPRLPNGKIDRHWLKNAKKSDSATPEGSAEMSQTERQLCDIWEEVLNISPIGLHDNFFDLGGHSILGIRLFVAIEKQLGVRFPVATLFKAPTVSQMAQHLQAGEQTRAWSPLLPIQPNGEKLPFFCIHGFGGGVIDYKSLADLLEPDRPFIGISALGRENGQSPHGTIEEMAAYYIEAMRVKQPAGPYHLGGYCYGGIVAYEMAHQLHGQGEEVALLAIFEGYAIGYDEAWQQLLQPRAIGHFLTNFPHWLKASIEQGSLRNRIGSLFEKSAAETTVDKIRDWNSAEAIDAVQQLIDQDASQLPAAHRKLFVTHAQAINTYDPPAYEGKVDLFRVKAMSALRATDPTMGWGNLALGGVAVHKIDGAHFNILEQPHVQSLAKTLQRCLNDEAAA